MAKKKVLAVVKIQIPAGQATPAPPVGTALGPHGVAIMDFCKAYNAQTESQRGTIVPVWASVAALYCLQKSMIATPWGPRAVPTGGAGVALPAAIWSFTSACTFFAMTAAAVAV